MMRRAIILVLLLGGCEQIDPFTREGAWRPMRISRRGSSSSSLVSHRHDRIHAHRPPRGDVAREKADDR